MPVNNERRIRIALLASGSGTNAEAIMRHFVNHPQVQISLLLSNNPTAYALERAKRFQVPTFVFTREQFRESEVVLQQLTEHKITHLVLAGFLWLVPTCLINAFPNKIINIHPALLPRYGGKGMYGERVHQAVKSSGDAKTGITIHLVNEHFDDGKIIFQAACEVSPSDTPETIASKVHALEQRHFPAVIERWVTA